jgi:excisionase family DNA binding protein
MVGIYGDNADDLAAMTGYVEARGWTPLRLDTWDDAIAHASRRAFAFLCVVKDGLRWIAPVLDVDEQWPEMLPRLLNPSHLTKGRLLLSDEEFADRVAQLIQERGAMSSKQIAHVMTAERLAEGDSVAITSSTVFALKRCGRFEHRGNGWVIRRRPEPARPRSHYETTRVETRRREVQDRLPLPAAARQLPERYANSRRRAEPLEPHYTIREVAEQLNLHQQTVWRACASGELTYRRVGRNVRIAKSAIEKWLGNRR